MQSSALWLFDLYRTDKKWVSIVKPVLIPFLCQKHLLFSNVTFRTTCTQDSKQVTVRQSISCFFFFWLLKVGHMVTATYIFLSGISLGPQHLQNDQKVITVWLLHVKRLCKYFGLQIWNKDKKGQDLFFFKICKRVI